MRRELEQKACGRAQPHSLAYLLKMVHRGKEWLARLPAPRVFIVFVWPSAWVQLTRFGPLIAQVRNGLGNLTTRNYFHTTLFIPILGPSCIIFSKPKPTVRPANSTKPIVQGTSSSASCSPFCSCATISTATTASRREAAAATPATTRAKATTTATTSHVQHGMDNKFDVVYHHQLRER